MAQWGIGGSKARGRHERPPPCHLILPLTLLLYSVHTHCLLSPNSLLLTPFLPKSILPSTIHIYFFLIEFLSCPLPSWHAPRPHPPSLALHHFVALCAHLSCQLYPLPTLPCCIVPSPTHCPSSPILPCLHPFLSYHVQLDVMGTIGYDWK